MRPLVDREYFLFPEQPVLWEASALSKSGLAIALKVEAPFQDRSWLVQNTFAYVGDEIVGYLRTACVDEENYRVIYPTPYHYLTERMGYSGDSLEDVANKYWVSEKKLISQARAEMKKEEEIFNKPFVDGSKVKEELRGDGIGTKLYLATAQYQASQQRKLYGSTLQSDEAKNLWEKFIRLGYSTETEHWTVRDVHILDIEKVPQEELCKTKIKKARLL